MNENENTNVFTVKTCSERKRAECEQTLPPGGGRRHNSVNKV